MNAIETDKMHLILGGAGMSRSALLEARILQAHPGAIVGKPTFSGERGTAAVTLPDGRSGTISGHVWKEPIGLTSSGGLPPQSPQRNVIDLWWSKRPR